MRTSIALRRAAVILAFALFLVMPRSGYPETQEDTTQLKAEIAKAWEARDFPRVEVAGGKYLAAMAKPDSPEHIVTLFCISGAETVAGRIDEAVKHLDQVLECVVRLTCQAQSPQHLVLAGLIFNFLQNMPPGSRGNMQVMLVKVWEAVSEKGRGRGPYASLYQGFSTMIAAGLARLYYLSGADSVARSFAGEAILSAPPAEVNEMPYTSDTVCGCIKIQTSNDFLTSSDDRRVDDYIAYARGGMHRFTHPPRALALVTGLEIFMKTKDTERLRRAAFALEELRDRSLTTGSLNDWPWLNEQINAQYKLMKEQYAHLWPAPKVFPAVSAAEADSDPRLGKTVPPYARKHVSRYGGESGKDYSCDYWPILLKTTVPAKAGKIPTDRPWVRYAPEGGRPPNATTPYGAGGAVADSPWWLYVLEEGRLRVVGRAETWNAGTRPEDPWELRVQRLALGNLWSVEVILDKRESREPLKLLGPVYVSQELLGPDFEDLPPHRQKLFRQGLPWVGMSSRLMRINLHACDKVMADWPKYSYDFQMDHVIECAGWTVTLRGGQIVDVTGPPSGTQKTAFRD
jgi:hypothetical protein